MVLSTVSFCFNFILFFVFVFLPIVFVIGLCVNQKSSQEDEIIPEQEEYTPPPPIVNHGPQTIKVRDGHYKVKSGATGKEAYVQKMTPEGARVYWVLTLPGNVVEQHWTKKAAVAVAIEKVK